MLAYEIVKGTGMLIAAIIVVGKCNDVGSDKLLE